MKTVKVKLYDYSELSETAKDKVLTKLSDIYEALKEAIKELKIHTTKHDLGMKKLIDQCEQAIAKAEGKE